MITRAPRITKKQWDAVFTCFVQDTTAKQAAKITGVSRTCANRYFRDWRERIFAACDHAPRFEGEIEIDIGFFGGRASKFTSAYVRRLAGLDAGRIVAERKRVVKLKKNKQMVLGFLRRHGDIFLLIVESKSRRQLEAAVRLVVRKGSIIYTDMEKGLARLKFDGYTHHQINHSVGYVDKGRHINGIESFWREARRGMGKNFRGIPRSTLRLHIKEREFRYNHRHDLAGALKALV